MTKISDALTHGLTIRESANDGSDFTNPAADYRRLFLGEDGSLHLRDSAGTITAIGGGAGDITTDAAWAAKGDLIVGTANNTAAVLTAGNNGKVLTAASGEATGLKWDTAAAGGVTFGADVATAGTFTATNSEGGQAAANVNDGNDTTYWSNGRTTFPDTLTCDFGVGVTKAVRKLSLVDDGATGYGIPSYWTCQYSDDNSAWYGAGPAFVFSPLGSATSTLHWRPPKITTLVFDEDPGAHRYWRITIWEVRNSTGATADYVRVRAVKMYEISAGTLP